MLHFPVVIRALEESERAAGLPPVPFANDETLLAGVGDGGYGRAYFGDRSVSAVSDSSACGEPGIISFTAAPQP